MEGWSAAPAGSDREVRLSVVLTNYNHARWLAGTIEALLAQVSGEDEIVIVDDGSTDASPEIIAGFRSRSPLVRLHAHATNRGAVAALGAGLALARGRYVYFAGADDRVLPGLFAKSLDMLAAHPAAALCCAEVRLEDWHGRVLGHRPAMIPAWRAGFISAAATRRLLQRIDNLVLGSAAVYRTDLVRRHGGFDPELTSFCDGYLTRRLVMEHGFCFIPEVLAVWRLNPESYSAAAMRSPDESLRILAAARTRFLEAPRDIVPARYVEALERRWRFNSARLMLVWDGTRFDAAAVTRMLGGGRADLRVLGFARRLPAGCRLAALVWLTLRLRPFALGPVFTSALRRLVLRPRARTGSALARILSGLGRAGRRGRPAVRTRIEDACRSLREP